MSFDDDLMRIDSNGKAMSIFLRLTDIPRQTKIIFHFYVEHA
jgi:hypothetical protein